jgi:hypothetical protein
MAAIIVRLMGGLGNQLFCYAMARRLALYSDRPLKLDVTSGFFRDRYKRQYMLDLFNIEQRVATPYESYMTGFGRVRRTAQRKVSAHLPLNFRSYLSQQEVRVMMPVKGVPHLLTQMVFNPEYLHMRPRQDLYIEGLWQDARYFDDIVGVLKREFTPAFPLTTETQSLAELLQRQDSVCVHVRLFQEVPQEQRKLANFGLGVTSPHYYRKAIAAIQARVHKPVFYCFTEVPELLSDLLPADIPIRMVTSSAVDKRQRDVEEFWLMRHCHHFISAPSTFSWWPSRLNDHISTIITVPDCGVWPINFHYKPPGLTVIEKPFSAE